MVQVLPDGTYLTVVMDSAIRGPRRHRILAAARAGHDLTEIEAAHNDYGRPRTRRARAIDYDVPDRTGNGSGELIVLLTTITDPDDAHAEGLAASSKPTCAGRTSPAITPT